MATRKTNMNQQRIAPIALDDVKVRFHNFAGGPLAWNPNNTEKSMTILVSDEQVDQLQKAGVTSVKPGYVNPNHPDSEPENRLPIKISYHHDGNRVWGPAVHLYTEGNPVPKELTEDTIGTLDKAQILKMSVVVNPHSWTSQLGTSGVNVYLRELYVVIRENRFATEFANYGKQPSEDLNVDNNDLPF